MKGILFVALTALCVMPYSISQVGVGNAGTARPGVQLAQGMADATQFSGADGCAKINAAVASLPAEGGMVDARGFDSPQTVSATCLSTAFANKNQIVEIDFSPSTRWVPAYSSMSVLSMNPRSIVKGLHVDASSVAGYTGSAVAFIQDSVGDYEYSELEDTQIDLPLASGIGIYIFPSETGHGYSGLNITGLRINNGLVGISMVSGPAFNQFLNGNNISNFWIRNAVTCISMDGSAQTSQVTWLSAMAANHFSNGSCQSGPNTLSTVVLKNSSDNSFSNVTSWDGGNATADLTSNYNYWSGFGSGQVANWPGVGNNYQDAHGDSISESGMHQFKYAGGVNFVGSKMQLANGSDAIQFLPSSYDGLPALNVSGGESIVHISAPLKSTPASTIKTELQSKAFLI